ncbi:putative hydroxymethylpyrimidine transporter CytX [Levilactobacillus bambusae]|uniref:Putative hydroxymethylpyrimidine transporter CytX n=1 Tax=Levilactobacillus bambusae TaxID=2024736 RepID=A0A2V1MZC1_9LACO|nr:putative hydroxymethylpyrimidine transporter CytX [Levilactobacillus bambusae]PWG00317.1 putative hydroxymethylpyrimidine transporter CytX [Levilactobacillus bambusae]
MEKTKLSSLFLLWLGAAISIAEIVTGTLLGPLGLKQGMLAIIIGHLIGCGLFLLPAAYISANQSQTAIQTTGMVFGTPGKILFSGLNALQLLGWTAVMLVNAQIAMNGITSKLFGYESKWVMTLIVAVLIIVWLILDHDWLFRINNGVVLLLALGTMLMLWAVTHVGILRAGGPSGSMTFGAAVELNVTMALSWLPLIGDYTKQTKRPVAISVVSVLGYFIGSVTMFSIGLLTVVLTHESDFATVLTHSKLGLVALFIIVFSTVTTTFMDAYSAATNITNITGQRNVNWIAVIITGLGTLIALGISMSYYENFLYAIGAVFAPLFAILFVSYFIMHGRLPMIVNFLWWIIGVFAYSWIQHYNFVCGPTLILLVGLSLCVWLSSLVLPKTPFNTAK